MEDISSPSSTPTPPRAVTIRDVATAAGVAASTVSRALSRPGRVNAATVLRIRQVADTLGYHSSAITASDSSAELSGMLAIVVADLGNPVFAEYARSAQHECFTHHLGLLVIDSEESSAVERAAVHLALPHVDGIILASSRQSDTAIRKLAGVKPLIAMNRSIRGIQSVIADTSTGLNQAVSHLAALGHRSITYISGPTPSWQNGVRWTALKGICAARHIALRRVQSSAPSFSGGYRCRDDFLANPTSAVIAYNDILAIGLIAALRAGGVAVPDQVSVVGIDDVQFSSLVSPALSTVRIPRRDLGTRAVDELTTLLHHTNSPGDLRPVVLDSQFIPRTSSGPASAPAPAANR